MSSSLIFSLLSFSSLTQKLQRSRECAREECLVATPGTCDAEEAGTSNPRTPRRTPGRAATPRRTPRAAATPRRTPGSRGRRTPEAAVRGVRTGGGRRQLVRMAALRSPFASPNTENKRMWVCYSDQVLQILFACFISECLLLCCNRKFDEDLNSVSSGIRRLKHLSKAFENIIGRDKG